MQHPRSVDMAAAAHLRERAQFLAKQYDLVASTSLLPAAGECIGQVTFLRKQAPDGPVLGELQATEAELATLMGQLVWDASQRPDHATAVDYYDQAIQAHKRPPGRMPGGLVGARYWRSSGRTLAAWGPLGPDVTSNSTAWPSSSER